MPPIYLIGNPETDQTLRIRENCGAYHNNAWICRRHGSIDFKPDGRPGLTRYLKGEIAQAGTYLNQHPFWEPSGNGETCCRGGTGYEGRLRLGSVEEVIRFLEQFFTVVECDR